MIRNNSLVVFASIFCFLACNGNVGNQEITMSGTIETEVTYVRSEVPSDVTDVNVAEGDRVSKGDILVVLDAGEYQKELSKLQKSIQSSDSAIQVAKKKLREGRKQAEKLKNKGFLGKVFSTKKGREKKRQEIRQAIIEAKTLLKHSQFQKKMLAEKASSSKDAMKLFKIESPADGIVSVLSVSKGESIKPGQILLSIAEADTAYFRSRINGFEKKQLSLEDTGVLYLEGDKRDEGLKVSIEKIADQSAFTPEHLKNDANRQEYSVRLAFIDDSSTLNLKPGMEGKAHFELANGEKQ